MKLSTLLVCALGAVAVFAAPTSVSALEPNCDTRREWCKDTCQTKLNFSPPEQMKCIGDCDVLHNCPPPNRWVHWPWESEKPCGNMWGLCKGRCSLPSCVQGCARNYEACFAQWPEYHALPPTTMTEEEETKLLAAASEAKSEGDAEAAAAAVSPMVSSSVGGTPVGRGWLDPTCKERLSECFTKYFELMGDAGCRKDYITCNEFEGEPIMPWSKGPSCAERLGYCSSACTDVYLGNSLAECQKYCHTRYAVQCGHVNAVAPTTMPVPVDVAEADAADQAAAVAAAAAAASRSRLANFARRFGANAN